MSIPSIDLSVFGSDPIAKQGLVRQIQAACESHGFFQLTGHGIPQTLLDQALEQSESFFSLPLEVKEKYNRAIDGFNRGYEPLRAQNFEKKTEGDLKEGYYFGLDLPLSHPKVVARKFNLGPNRYPTEVKDAAKFKQVADEYLSAMLSLAEKLFRLICESLEVGDSWVSEFVDTPIATLRLLHYPPQAPDAPEWERGIGAHTDFGALTILLQDMVGGLQVWDRADSQWKDVIPTRGALVVNLGNLMMRWTNDRYLSNLHRVINKSGQESHLGSEYGAKYPPVTVEEWIAARYADTYGTSKEKAMGELSTTEAAASASQ